MDGDPGESRVTSRLPGACVKRSNQSLLVVTIREGEERGFYSAAWNLLVDIIEDQVRERGVVVFVWSKESAIWKDTSVKALIRPVQLKYIDGEEVMTNQGIQCSEHRDG